MPFNGRRVVTGLNGEGKSCVISDKKVEDLFPRNLPSASIALVWRTEEYPVSNDSNEETAENFDPAMFDSSSSMFILLKAEPGGSPAWHATNTIDYLVVLSGRIMLDLEAGGVELGVGDLVIDRGVNHSWKVIGDEPAVMAASLIRSDPLGAGSRFDESFTQRFAQ